MPLRGGEPLQQARPGSVVFVVPRRPINYGHPEGLTAANDRSGGQARAPHTPRARRRRGRNCRRANHCTPMPAAPARRARPPVCRDHVRSPRPIPCAPHAHAPPTPIDPPSAQRYTSPSSATRQQNGAQPRVPQRGSGRGRQGREWPAAAAHVALGRVAHTLTLLPRSRAEKGDQPPAPPRAPRAHGRDPPPYGGHAAPAPTATPTEAKQRKIDPPRARPAAGGHRTAGRRATALV